MAAGIERVDWLYEVAFGRPPTDEERATGMSFVESQAAEYGASVDDPRVWADYCHVLINVKEFVFVP